MNQKSENVQDEPMTVKEHLIVKARLQTVCPLHGRLRPLQPKLNKTFQVLEIRETLLL